MMRQVAAAEVRLDASKANRFNVSAQSTGVSTAFCPTRSAVCRCLKDDPCATIRNPGNVGSKRHPWCSLISEVRHACRAHPPENAAALAPTSCCPWCANAYSREQWGKLTIGPGTPGGIGISKKLCFKDC